MTPVAATAIKGPARAAGAGAGAAAAGARTASCVRGKSGAIRVRIESFIGVFVIFCDCMILVQTTADDTVYINCNIIDDDGGGRSTREK